MIAVHVLYLQYDISDALAKTSAAGAGPLKGQVMNVLTLSRPYACFITTEPRLLKHALSCPISLAELPRCQTCST